MSITIAVNLNARDVQQVSAIVFDSVRAMRVHMDSRPIPPTWQFAPVFMRHDTEVAVRRIATGTTRSAQQLHEQWRDEQWQAGWRYGEVADEDNLKHPHICDYAALAPDAQARYSLLFAVASNVLASVALLIAARTRTVT